MKKNEKKLKALQAQVDEFNSTYAVGCRVTLTLDSGEIKSVNIKEKATVLGGHSAVAWFDGISGCYLIDRVNQVK